VYPNENESPVRKNSSLAILNLAPAVYPARTRFYSLPPKRLGTPLVESLCSYIAALAKEHSCSTSNFLKEEIIPLSQRISGPSFGSSADSRPAKVECPRWKDLNSYGPVTTRVVAALEYGTGVSEICRMTLLSLDGVVTQGALYPQRRWCPYCLEEFRNSGRVFEPLLWSLSLVSSCSIHKAPLQSSCGRCSRTSSYLREWSVPGHCPWCGFWEGTCGDDQSETMNADLSGQGRMTNIVGEFLAQLSSSRVSADAFILRRNLRRCIEVCNSGNIADLLRAYGMSGSTCLYESGGLMSLQNLVSFASRLHLSVSQFFEVDDVACEQAWGRAASLLDRSVLKGSLLRPPWLRGILAEAAIETPPPALQTVAKRNGYKSTTMLRRAAPKLCDVIAENYLLSVRSGEQKMASAGKFSRQIDIQAVLEEELSKDIPRSIDEIAHSLRYAAAQCLRRVAPEMCKKITKKRSDRRKCALVQQKRTLSLALEEEPAPSPKELVVRLALRNCDQLRNLDQGLYRSLCTRHRMRQAKERDYSRSLIHDCLQQANPRWKDIEHCTGWSRSRIRLFCPDLYAKAKVICKESWDTESKSNLNAAEGHIRRAVEQLLASGIQPSVENVHRVVPKGPYLGTTWTKRILRKIRQEEGLATTSAAA